MLPLVLFAAGALVKQVGQFQADAAQAGADRQNASYYKEQQGFELEQMFREVGIFDRKSTRLQGEQLVHAGSSGTAITSFTLDQLGYQNSLMEAEKQQIIRQGEFKAKLAGMRAQSSTDDANALSSPERTLANAGGLLTSFAALA